MNPAVMTVNYAGLPESLQGGVRRWLEAGIQPGSFLSAVIANDLREACGRADDNNRRRLFEIVKWFYNECPSPACGDLAKATLWASRFGREWNHP